jgi:hypothetical protein
MTKHSLLPPFLLFGLLSCDPSSPNAPASTPNDPSLAPASNPNKLVFAFDETTTITCSGGAVLTRNQKGWVQIRGFRGAGTRNLELDVFHQVLTYTNTAGQTFAFRDVGPDRYYLNQAGELVIAITGRSTGSGVIGHVVINLDTGEVLLVAGKEFGLVDDLACATLT